MQTIEHDRYGPSEGLAMATLADPAPVAGVVGDPHRRDRALVMQDLRDEKINAASAGRDSGVEAATAGNREQA